MQDCNALQIFSYEGIEVRTVLDEKGNPWWVAKDVCTILEIKNVNHAVNGNPARPDDGLDEDERGYYIVTTPRGNQKMLCVNEPGLYALIFKSRKPEAKAFKRWVKHEVLPSIRKTGSYSIHQQPKQSVSSTPLADRLAATVEEVEDNIPDMFFAMATETHREVRHAEFLNQLDQDATAFPEISVGRLWAKHVRAKYHINTKDLPTYEHTGPGLKITVLPRCYPMEYLKEFRRWFREDYLPNHCPVYIGNRKKRLERQARIAGTTTRQIAG